jgi:SAM-dependent methyltransferase
MQTREDIRNAGFLGGPPKLFDSAGREQLIVLLEYGLKFDSMLLDIGCGCLRGGRWMIPLLDGGHYFGIESNRHMVDKGLESFIAREMIELKKPRFDYNDQFDFSVFNVKFTHFIARSIWTHASKPQVEQMLDGFAASAEPNGVMLTSYVPAKIFGGRADYQGARWIGQSHESEERGMIAHSFGWLQAACRRRGLTVRRVPRAPFNEQVWLEVSRTGSKVPFQLRYRTGLLMRLRY